MSDDIDSVLAGFVAEPPAHAPRYDGVEQYTPPPRAAEPTDDDLAAYRARLEEQARRDLEGTL